MKSTKTAWAVTAVVVALSAILGCNRSLAHLHGQAVMVSIQGSGGYSILTDCQDMVNTARNLSTVAQKYLPADDPSITKLEALCTQLEDLGQRGDMAVREKTVLELRAACRDLQAELSPHGQVTEKDRGYLSGFDVDLDAAMARMEKDPYNAAARDFNRAKGRFPANVLGFLVKPLHAIEF